jgi:hypothetical protein
MQSGTNRDVSLRDAYKYAEHKDLSHDVAAIKEMEIEWDRSYTTTVRKGRALELLEINELLPAFISEKWPDGRTSYGEWRTKFCIKIWHEYRAFLNGEELSNDRGSDEELGLEFALEAHLRDFLARNLQCVEPGLRLFEKDGKVGVEFIVDQGRIDLLAIDRNGKFVVIELKLSQGRNKTLGQLLYYMGWVDRNLGNGPCRGLIIAREITDDLKVAVSRVPGVSLVRYLMSFALESAQ